MTLPDLINGGFEALGAAALSLNVVRLYRDKQVKGIHWGATTFFFTWGLWNLFYYQHLDQLFSWYAGMAVVSVNGVWLGMMLYYMRRALRTT